MYLVLYLVNNDRLEQLVDYAMEWMDLVPLLHYPFDESCWHEKANASSRITECMLN